jgi:hypothetical protein
MYYYVLQVVGWLAAPLSPSHNNLKLGCPRSGRFCRGEDFSSTGPEGRHMKAQCFSTGT